MNILEQLAGTLDARTLQGLGQAIGASPEQTQAAVQVALPTLLGALGRNSATPDGAAALHTAVQRDHTQVDLGGLLGGLLGGPASGSASSLGDSGFGALLGAVTGMMGGAAPSAPPAVGGLAQSGAAILKHVLGGAQPRAADGVAKSAGISPAAAGQLMAMLAPLVMGAIGRMQRQDGLDAGGLAKAIQQDAGRVGAAPGQGGFASLLDTDGDGDVDVADLMRHGSTLFTMFGKR